ncbi:unnamed protein product [Leuciscus chuanchicus]
MDLSIIYKVGAVGFRALRPLLNFILEHPQIRASLLEPSSPHRVMEERVRALMALPIVLGNEDVGSEQCMDSIQDLLKEVEAAIESRDDLRQKVEVLIESRNVWRQEVQVLIESRNDLRQKVQSLSESREDLRHEIVVLQQFRNVLRQEVMALTEFRNALRLEADAANGQLSQLNMNELVVRLVPVLKLYCNKVQEWDNTMKVLKDNITHYPDLTQRHMGRFSERVHQREAEDPRGTSSRNHSTHSRNH